MSNQSKLPFQVNSAFRRTAQRFHNFLIYRCRLIYLIQIQLDCINTCEPCKIVNNKTLNSAKLFPQK